MSKRKYHKLPGGGLNAHESILSGLKREILEETGCTIKVKKRLGTIVEYRTHLKILQTSHCFLATVVRQGKSQLEPDEKADGFKLIWVPIEKALRLLQNEKPKTYDGKFIVKRDFIFLSKANEWKKKKLGQYFCFLFFGLNCFKRFFDEQFVKLD